MLNELLRRIFRIVPGNSGIFTFWTFFLSLLFIYTWKNCGIFVVFCQAVHRREELTNEIVTKFIFRIISAKPTDFQLILKARSLIGWTYQVSHLVSISSKLWSNDHFGKLTWECRLSEILNYVMHAVTSMSHLNLLIILNANWLFKWKINITLELV